jgi:hypothetical protein
MLHSIVRTLQPLSRVIPSVIQSTLFAKSSNSECYEQLSEHFSHKVQSFRILQTNVRVLQSPITVTPSSQPLTANRNHRVAHFTVIHIPKSLTSALHRGTSLLLRVTSHNFMMDKISWKQGFFRIFLRFPLLCNFHLIISIHLSSSSV